MRRPPPLQSHLPPLSSPQALLLSTLLSVSLSLGCDDTNNAERSEGGVSASSQDLGVGGEDIGGESAGVTAGVRGGLMGGTTAGVTAGVMGGSTAGVMGGSTAGVMGGTEPERVPVSSDDQALDGLDPSLIDTLTQTPRSSDPRCEEFGLLYPEAGTVIPANLFGLTLQWAPLGEGPYMVTAWAGDNRARWLTTQRQLTPDGVTWELLKRASLGGELTFTLSTLLDGARCEGPETPIEVDRSELLGAVYYWSTTDSGIMRLAAGEREPEPLLTPAVSPELNCPACHALSRDGQRIAFTRTSFPPFGDLATSNISDPRSLLYNPMGVEGYFPSFSPNSRYLAAGSSGRIVLRSSETGEELNSLTLPPMTVGGVPDWSWRGDRIVGVVGPTGLMNIIPNEGINMGSIYEWVQQSGERGLPGSDPSEWGEPQLLVAPMGDLSNDRPAYDPTGQFIAFNTEGDDPTAGDGRGNRNVALWIVPVGQSAPTPIALARANKADMQGNSWPKWAPADGRGRLWLAFSSFRDYGHLLPDNPNGARRPQIWVTAIDPNAPEGSDPSAPAFWLPFQNIESGNHIPYWAAYEKR